MRGKTGGESTMEQPATRAVRGWAFIWGCNGRREASGTMKTRGAGLWVQERRASSQGGKQKQSGRDERGVEERGEKDRRGEVRERKGRDPTWRPVAANGISCQPLRPPPSRPVHPPVDHLQAACNTCCCIRRGAAVERHEEIIWRCRPSRGHLVAAVDNKDAKAGANHHHAMVGRCSP